MHPLVSLARSAITQYVTKREVIKPPADIPEEFLKRRAGVFVSLKKHGELRGCIGTFLPVTESIAHEVIRNAIAAATQDPRFYPVRPEELEEITCSVDLLSEPEKVDDPGSLDEKIYGVIVSKGPLKGLLLPDIEGVNSVEEQLRIAKMKAGISPEDTEVDIYRFRVERFH
ncbi:MAG: AmmeMemoRadiSam system protein A [Nitrospirae bacterium]|nr:MAG: AmmeMemoRadiSam system protein A [Nitrospirota bacterium]